MKLKRFSSCNDKPHLSTKTLSPYRMPTYLQKGEHGQEHVCFSVHYLSLKLSCMRGDERCSLLRERVEELYASRNTLF